MNHLEQVGKTQVVGLGAEKVLSSLGWPSHVETIYSGYGSTATWWLPPTSTPISSTGRTRRVSDDATPDETLYESESCGESRRLGPAAGPKSMGQS